MIGYLVTGALASAVVVATVSGGKPAAPPVTTTVFNPFTLTRVAVTAPPTASGKVASASPLQSSVQLATVMVSDKPPPPRSKHKPPHPGDGDGGD